MDVRGRILEAALGLLAESGAHELTQPKVARAAGVRQSHLTYYFPTRGELLQEVARHSIDKLAGQLAQRHGSLADGIAAGAGDKRRSRVMLGLVAAADRDPAIKRRMRRFVLFTRRTRERHADRDVAAFVRWPRAQAAVEHGHAEPEVIVIPIRIRGERFEGENSNGTDIGDSGRIFE